MKFDDIRRIYNEKIRDLFNDGWIIDPVTNGNTCTSAVEQMLIFTRKGEYKAIFIDTKYYDRPLDYANGIRICVGTPNLNVWDPGCFIGIDKCINVAESVYILAKQCSDWYVSPQEYPDIIQKRDKRYLRNSDLNTARFYLGGDSKTLTPEAKQIAKKLARKVKGYGNTSAKQIETVWFEHEIMNTPDGKRVCGPVLCIKVEQKYSEARIPMPGYRLDGQRLSNTGE